MIPKDLEQKIGRLYAVERWKIGTIAKQLGVHHNVVERVIRDTGLPVLKEPRRAMVDPYVPFIVETLTQYPDLPSSRLFAMVKERGYPGGPDHFRGITSRYRPRQPAEAFLRRRTLPGEEAQVDWASFGKVKVGRAVRSLHAFVMVLSFSRLVFLTFCYGSRMPAFLLGHNLAFEYFGGVPRRLLYDNLKSAVLERQGDAIRFHPTLLDLAAYYQFDPRPVAPYRGNEKGRVERAIRYTRSSFFPARTWTGLDDLNEQARAWCDGTSADRQCPGDRTQTVREAVELERPLLMPLPGDPFPSQELVAVKSGKMPYVRFDLNDYSVPHTHVRRALTVVASPDTVRVLDGVDLIATHARSFDKAQIEDPSHVQALVDVKRAARNSRGMDRLAHAVPAAHELLVRVAHQGGNLGSATSALLRLLETHGAATLEAAVEEALGCC